MRTRLQVNMAASEDVLGNGKLMKKILVEAPEGSPGPIFGDEVTLHYVGTLQETGEEFDSSRSRGEPITFKLGNDEVISGWDEGVVTMCRGERAMLTIHPDLAYGEKGDPPKIPPNATLCYDIELLDFTMAPEDEDGDEDEDGELSDMDLENLTAGEDDDDLDGYGRKDLGAGGDDPEGKFTWERRGLEVLVTAPIGDDVGKKDIKQDFLTRRVSMSVKGQVLFAGVPGCEVDPEESYWEIDEDKKGRKCLFVHLVKRNSMSRWPDELLKAVGEPPSS